MTNVMINLKKLKVLLLGIMFFMILGNARGQITDIHIFGKRSSGVEGDVIRVPVIVDTEGFGQEGIIAFRLDLTYSANMKFVSTSLANTPIANWNTQTNTLSTTSFSFNAAGINPIQQDSAVLFFIDFELLEVPYTTQGYYYISGQKNYFNEGSYNITMPQSYGYVDILNKDQLSVGTNNSLLAKGDSTLISASGGASPYTFTSSDPNVAVITSEKYLKGVTTGNVFVNVTDEGGLTGKTGNIEVRGFRLTVQNTDELIYPGSSFTAQIRTSDLSGMGILSGKFDFTVSGATLKSISSEGTLLQNASVETKDLGSNNYRVVFANSSALNGSGILINVVIDVPSTSNSCTIYSAGIPQMNETQIGIFDQKTIYFTALPNLNISAIGSVPNPIYPGTEIGFQVTSQTGNIAWSLTNPEVGTIDANGLFTAQRSGQTSIKVTDDLGATSQYGPLTIKDGYLEVASQVAMYNSEHLLPIRISALPADRALFAYDMKLNIDTTKITFIEVVKTGSLSENFSVVSNNSDPRNIRIVGAGQQSINTAGDLFYFKIRLKETFTSSLTYIYITNTLFNEGLPDLQLTYGTVTPGNPPPVSGDQSITATEDTEYTFSATDFPYSQAQNTVFEYVKIITLPAAGSLVYNGGNVTVNQVISVGSLQFLSYKGPKDQSGDALDSFTFKVGDNTSFSNNTGTMTISITPVNDPPVFELSAGSITVDEDFADAVVVSVINETHPAQEGDETYTYSLSPASVDFAGIQFNAATGQVTISSVADGFGSQLFMITGDDGQASNNHASKSFNLTVTNVNDAPVTSDVSFSLDENTVISTTIGTVTATDVDMDVLNFSITAGNESGAFTIGSNSGILSVASSAPLDFEVTPVFILTVSISDGSETVTSSVTISLNDVFEAPNQAPQIADQSFSLLENAINGLSVATVSASDPENDPITFSIVSGANGAFAINSTTGVITVTNQSLIDFETTPVFTLTISVSDGELSASATVTINLTDVDETVNQAPQITDQTFAIAENSANGTVVSTVFAGDPDGDALTYTIISGSDAFALNSSTGELTVARSSQLDYEMIHFFTMIVEVSDGALTNAATITINLTDVEEGVNEAPVIANQTFIIAENTPAGTVVGQIVASDPNGNALSFIIPAGNTAAFSIDENTGVLMVANQNLLDFETSPVINITVEVSDGALMSSATITINLTDVDENSNQAPIIADQSFSIAENSINGTLIGSIVAVDPNSDPLTYTIVSGGNGAFSVHSTLGSITVANQTLLDFETTPVFTMTVSVSDGVLAASATITIQLTDVNENQNQAPVINNQSFSIAENSTNATLVGTVIATDPENSSLNFSITNGNSLGTFAIDNAGKLSILSNTNLDFERNPVFTLTVQVSDGQLSASATVTVNVTDVNEVVLGMAPITVVCYPNPVVNTLTLSGINATDIRQIRIIDQNGKIVFEMVSPSILKLDFSGFSSGLYFLQIFKQKEILQFRIVK